ncbi:MAG: ABC transporter substrate-binding protein [Chloroflexi bacterium]|nr:ABC transporter substrate-binding protein [Chloroflexota bacterium]
MRNNAVNMTLAVVVFVVSACAPAAAPTPAPKAPATTPVPTKAVGAAPTQAPATKPAPAPAAPAATPKPTAAQAKPGGTLYIAHYADPATYDPLQEASLQSESLVIPSYSGVVQHDPLQPAKVIGDIAEKWDMSADGLTYTFNLFKNVKWHDDAPFTAEDARFSLQTVRQPPRGVNSPRQALLKAVNKIEAPDATTLRITLQYPSASFVDNLADGRMVVVPKHIFEAKGNMKKDIVGTGPFRFKSFTPGTSFSVVKSGDYFIKGRPYLDGITWYIIPDVATRFAALRTHRVQGTPFGSQGITPSQSEILRKELADKVVTQTYPSLVFLAVRMPNNKAPWNDVRVRRAVELTIERQKVIKVAVEGVGDVGFFPPGEWSLPPAEVAKMPGYRPDKEADIAEARKLMADAGLTQGFKVTTITRNVPQQERATLSVKEQLAQIGIDITISLKDQATMYDLLFKRNYDLAVFGTALSSQDPDQVLGTNFLSGVPYNFSEFSDEKIDKWYDEQARALDPAKRKNIVLESQRRLHELVPASMLFWYVYELSYWSEVKDWKAGIGIYNNLKFQNVWLQK